MGEIRMEKNSTKQEKIEIRVVGPDESEVVDEVVGIHMRTFKGFFLTFMGKGFLRQMYQCYCLHDRSGLLVAEDEGRSIGFLAFSLDMSELYRFMIKKKLPQFAWYSLGAFVRKPGVFLRIIRAFLKPGESKRPERYVELSSIGVDPHSKSKGVGSMLVDTLKTMVSDSGCSYISLETDAVDNDGVNRFYQANGFELERKYSTPEGRLMNEYRFLLRRNR